MPRLRTDRGFTIAELMVALFVAALLMTATLSLLTNALPRWRLRHAVLDVVTSIQAARARAVLERTEVTMPFDTARRMYTLADRGSGGSSTHTETVSGVVTWFAELPPGVEFVRPDSGDVVTLTPPGSGGDVAARFGETGLLESDNRPGDVYIGIPGRDLYQRVRVMLAGTVHVETWNGSEWQRR